MNGIERDANRSITGPTFYATGRSYSRSPIERWSRGQEDTDLLRTRTESNGTMWGFIKSMGSPKLVIDTLLEGMTDDEWAGHATTLSDVVCLSREDQVDTVTFMLTFLEYPTPPLSILLDESAGARERSVVFRAFHAFKWLGTARLDVIIKHDTSGLIRLILKKAWTNILKWMKYLLANDHAVSVVDQDPVKTSQWMIGFTCAFLCDMCEVGCFLDEIMQDTALSILVVTAYTRQDVEVLISLDKAYAFSDAPTLVLTRFIAQLTIPFMLGTPHAAIDLLRGKERGIVNMALQHLKNVPKMESGNDAAFRKIRLHLTLLLLMDEVESIKSLLSKSSTVSQVVSSLKYAIDIHSIPSSILSQDSSLFETTIQSSLQYLDVVFTRRRADLAIRTALSDRVEQALLALTRAHNENGYDDASGVSMLLARFASYTCWRTVVGSVVRCVGRAFTRDPILHQYRTLGRQWSLVRRYAMERFICKYLFDEAYRRYGVTCANCQERIPRYEIKRCSACKFCPYCSRRCQRLNWRAHKQVCRKQKIIKEQSEKECGRYDQLFRDLLARQDLPRVLPCVYDDTKRRRNVFLDDIRIRLDYAVTPDAMHPLVTYTILPSGEAEMVQQRLISMSSKYDRVMNGSSKIFNVEVVVPAGKKCDTMNMFVPVDKRWVEVALDENNPLRERRAKQAADEGFHRVDFRFRDHRGMLQRVHSAGDDVDDILFELSRVSDSHPDRSILRRVGYATAKVERSVHRSTGRDIYEKWVCRM